MYNFHGNKKKEGGYLPSSFLFRFVSLRSIMTSMPIAEPAKMNVCAVNHSTEGEISPVGGTMKPATAMPVPTIIMNAEAARLYVMRFTAHCAGYWPASGAWSSAASSRAVLN